MIQSDYKFFVAILDEKAKRFQFMNDEIFSPDDAQFGALPSMAALAAFERAAARSSFAEAGKDLGRTPSAVSHAIKDMETKLGVDLFERAGRTVRLTEAGAVYFEAVQRALSGLRVATDRLRRTRDDNVIRISALPFFTSAVLLPNLARFEKDHPAFDLRIETTNAYADIVNGEADIGIRFGKARSEDLVCVPLISVSGRPIASPRYLETAPKLDRLEDFNRHALIHVRQNEAAWRQWYAGHGGETLRSTRNLNFDSLLGSLDAVKRGLGVGLAMHPLIESYPGFGSDFVPVFDALEAQSRDYYFVCRTPIRSDKKIRSVLAWLEAALGRLSESAR